MEKVIDITPILMVVLTGIMALLAGWLIPAIRLRTTQTQQELIQAWVKAAVYAAERYYTSDEGAEKFAYVTEFLRQKGMVMDLESLRVLVEAELLQMKGMDPELEYLPDPGKDRG